MNDARPLPLRDVPGWDDVADVVVVGHGGAGAAAAIEAARAGADTLVLERASRTSALWAQFGYLCDVFVVRGRNEITWYEELPFQALLEGAFHHSYRTNEVTVVESESRRVARGTWQTGPRESECPEIGEKRFLVSLDRFG